MNESNADFSASIENDLLNRISQKTGIDIDEIYAKEAPTIRTNDYELSVDENGNRYIEDEISQENLDYYQDLAEREEYYQISQKTSKKAKEVISALKNPIAVIKAEQNKNETEANNRYSAILDLQNEDGYYVLVAIEVNKKTGNSIVNDIRSIHSRKNYEPIIDKAFNDKRLLKVDADKIKDLLTSQQSDIISDGAASLIDKIYQQQNNVKLYQSAYHGTPHRFEEFSTEHIGTGEGAQAHGWGLYFAKNKNVSEEYRKILSTPKKNMTYDGKKIKDTELSKIIPIEDVFFDLVRNGKDSALKLLNKKKDIAEKNIKENKSSFLVKHGKKFLEDFKEYKKIIENTDNSKFDNYSFGQLFEVDIPEDDVLLNEDLPLNKQPEKVKKAIFNYMKDNTDIYNMSVIKNYNELSESRDGKWFYKEVAFNEMLKGANDTGAKEASLLLNKYGIKGIKYNGRRDGECYVIFDNKAVDVLKTYFQSAKVGDNIAKSKEKYLNSKQSALKNFYDIHRNFTENEPKQYTGKKTIKNVLEYLGSKNNKTAEIKTPIENITVTRNNIKHLLEDNEDERSNYINRFVRTLQSPNLVIKTLENDKTYNYYIKSFSSDNNKISGHVQVIKKCSDGSFYVTNHHLHNSKFNKALKNGQIIFDLSDLSAVQNAPDNNSITDNAEKINPKTVHLYNITEYKTFNQEIQPSLFEGNNKAREIHKVKGSFMPAEKIIELFKNADISTIIHEYAHWYLSVMERYANVSAEITEDLNEVRKFVKNSGEEFTQEQHEKFAQGFEAYVYFGKAPTIQDVKNYINELVESGKKFATLSPEWFIDVKGGKRTTNKILNAGNYKRFYKKDKERHNKYIMSLEKILANARYLNSKDNIKKDKKPNIAFIKNNDDSALIKLVWDDKKRKWIVTAFKDKKALEQAVDSTPDIVNIKGGMTTLPNSSSATNIIPDNAENLNPKTVHLYNITEYKTFNQEIQPSLFEGNNKAREIHKVKGSFMPAEKIIELFKNADIYDVIINKKC